MKERRTADIVAGIPRVTELFEARPARKAMMPLKSLKSRGTSGLQERKTVFPTIASNMKGTKAGSIRFLMKNVVSLKAIG